MLKTGNTLKERLRGYLDDINTGNTFKLVSKHLTSYGHSKHNVTMIGITSTPKNLSTRLRTEEALIYKLATAEPWGLYRKPNG